MYGNPEVTTGGRALKFYSSVRIDVRRVEALKVGGEVIGSSSAVGGTLALETAANFNVDLMFFSAYGINSRGMIVDTSEEETELRTWLMTIEEILSNPEPNACALCRACLCNKHKRGVRSFKS